MLRLVVNNDAALERAHVILRAALWTSDRTPMPMDLRQLLLDLDVDQLEDDLTLLAMRA